MTYTGSDLTTLTTMHTYCRANKSKGEELFIKRYLDPVPGMLIDGYGNRMLTIKGNDKLMFSCHTDTVHMQAANPRQDVIIENDLMKLAKPENGYCLGADDGAGVWLMLEMINADIPGLYIFHREEESGGRGSGFIAYDTPHILEGIEMAIAFDRLGYSSVITHQGERTASETFAYQLGQAIGLPSLAPDSTGLFTDTANYSNLISECTNVSVGYASNHGPNETLDVAFLIALRNALLKAPWDTLYASRDPDSRDDFEYEPMKAFNDNGGLTSLIQEYPELAASVLEQYGLTEADFREEILTTYGDY